MYSQLYREAGFELIGTGPGGAGLAREGDVLLFRVRSRVANHGAVYFGSGQILHHPSSLRPYDPTQMSRRESLHRYQRMLVSVLRHEK